MKFRNEGRAKTFSAFKWRAISSFAALAISVALVIPPAVASKANGANLPSSAVTVRNESAEGAQEKGDGNAFVRAITAPFRALGRLFGGGKKKKKDQAKKREHVKPEVRTTATAPNSNDANAAAAARVETSRAVPLERESAPAHAKPVRPVPAAPAPSKVNDARETTGANSARPNDFLEERRKQGLWVPVIEGVPKDHLSQGRALLAHGYLNEAIAELSIAATMVGMGTNLVEANNLLGLAYDRLGWHQRARECYERALSVAPKDPVVLANLGNSLYLSNDLNGALKRLKRAAELAPGMSVVYHNIGIVQARRGKFDDAFKSFARASNQYDAHLKVAGILETEKRDRDALKHYEAALKLQPGTSAVLERLVALYERTGQHDKAETARRALGRPANPQRTTTGGGGG